MVPAIEWTNVHLAGAFLIGWLFGTVVTLRLLRVVTAMVDPQRWGPLRAPRGAQAPTTGPAPPPPKD